jgi:putative DNA methylase
MRTARCAKAQAVLADGRGGVRLGSIDDVLDGQADAAVLCADSATVELPSGSIDAIVTDPPYFDRIEYDDLAAPFLAWLQWCGVDCEAGMRGIQSSHIEEFASSLEAALKPAVTGLKQGASIIFTYHHQEPDAWISLAQALKGLPLRTRRVDLVPADVPHSRMKHRAAMPITTDAVLHLVKDARHTTGLELDSWVQQAISQLGNLPSATSGDRVNAAYAFAVGAYLAHGDVPQIRQLLTSVRARVECLKN